MSLMDLPDELIQMIAESMSDYCKPDIVDFIKNFRKFYVVNKRFYQLSTYYVIKHMNNSVHIYPPRLNCYKYNYYVTNNTLVNYSSWNLPPSLSMSIYISNGFIGVYGKSVRIYDQEKCTNLLKAIYDVMPNHMKTFNKQITLSPTSFPSFESFINDYLKL